MGIFITLSLIHENYGRSRILHTTSQCSNKETTIDSGVGLCTVLYTLHGVLYSRTAVQAKGASTFASERQASKQYCSQYDDEGCFKWLLCNYCPTNKVSKQSNKNILPPMYI